MLRLKEKYVTDGNGRKTAVVLEMRDYRRLRGYLEDLEDARDLIRAEKTATKFISWEEMKRRLKASGKG